MILVESNVGSKQTACTQSVESPRCSHLKVGPITGMRLSVLPAKKLKSAICEVVSLEIEVQH